MLLELPVPVVQAVLMQLGMALFHTPPEDAQPEVSAHCGTIQIILPPVHIDDDVLEMSIHLEIDPTHLRDAEGEHNDSDVFEES